MCHDVIYNDVMMSSHDIIYHDNDTAGSTANIVTTLVTEILKIVVNVITVYQSPGNDNVSRSDDDSEGEIYY